MEASGATRPPCEQCRDLLGLTGPDLEQHRVRSPRAMLSNLLGQCREGVQPVRAPVECPTRFPLPNLGGEPIDVRRWDVRQVGGDDIEAFGQWIQHIPGEKHHL